MHPNVEKVISDGGNCDGVPTAPRRSFKHVLVREYVRSAIRGAEPGSPIPSERELVASFGVARMTVRQAVDALVAEGVLERFPGRGTFVAMRRAPVRAVVGYTHEARRAGVAPSARTLVIRFMAPTPTLADLFDSGAGDRVMQWERLRFTDGEVTALQMVYLNTALLKGWPVESPPVSLYEELARRGLAPTSCEDVLKPSAATPREAALLEIAPGAPVLRQQRRTLWGERTIEVSSSVHRFDRFRLRYHSGVAVS